ncbi:hypothetical protein EC253486_2776 [Escherichia coli 2534-86]|nr:hypothetical protein EC253486_2776 [Escherichia coli 2534-86]EHW09861.1 hypothetical protein ECDEC8A_2554 [Escherichia coli DEC8A]EHW11910.1 hypothetical protein ECDEC8B_2800 [Escherichia coli DEC8B]EHW28050.1 hypothetical protein ECDEC8E_2685 [Escherichia coli DEC8E]EIH79772.1 hypothetical protein EC40522_2495 [Escherichia coli 4.0522]EIH91864.1 hypothetical protein ECJB195_1628 [Escherichia coli JB1-95]
MDGVFFYQYLTALFENTVMFPISHKGQLPDTSFSGCIK